MNHQDLPKLKFGRFAVIGDPIEHSLSPCMHNAAFKALGIQAIYEAVHVKTDELAIFAKEAKQKYDGFNVTVPHKNNIIKFLDGIFPSAKFAGSVNTVINKDGLLWGDSTDGKGLELALKSEFSISITQKNVFFIGCGGACRAAAFHFASVGVKSLFFVNRTLKKAEELVSLIKKEFPFVNLHFSTPDDESFVSWAINQSDLIIQSTSLGLKKNDQSPLAEKFFIPEKFYYDMIYGNTEFIRLAKKYNCRSANGLSMLLYQGVESFKKWTNIEPPVRIMKDAIDNKTFKTS